MRRLGSFFARLIAVGTLVAMVIGIFLFLGTMQARQDTAAPGQAATPTPTAHPYAILTPSPEELTPPKTPPTPVPTRVLPYMTPGPTVAPGTEDKKIPLQVGYTPVPTPRPEDPYLMVFSGDGIPTTDIVARESQVIALGTVKQIMPARWSTDNGGRPANPRVPPFHTIGKPVRITIEQYLKGEQPSTELFLLAVGGKIGQDSVTYGGKDGRYTFYEGERVIVFLSSKRGRTMNGGTLWDVVDHYTIQQDGRATNRYRTVLLQELIDEIHGLTNR